MSDKNTLLLRHETHKRKLDTFFNESKKYSTSADMVRCLVDYMTRYSEVSLKVIMGKISYSSVVDLYERKTGYLQEKMDKMDKRDLMDILANLDDEKTRDRGGVKMWGKKKYY